MPNTDNGQTHSSNSAVADDLGGGLLAKRNHESAKHKWKGIPGISWNIYY